MREFVIVCPGCGSLAAYDDDRRGAAVGVARSHAQRRADGGAICSRLEGAVEVAVREDGEIVDTVESFDGRGVVDAN